MVALEFSHRILASKLKGPKRHPGFNCQASNPQIPNCHLDAEGIREEHKAGGIESAPWDHTHMHVQVQAFGSHYECVQTSWCQVLCTKNPAKLISRIRIL